MDRWQDFDWRSCEARLNAYPQFLTRIDGQPGATSCMSARPCQARSLSCSATGGQESVFEYLDLIDRLTDPAAYGADPADAFHVVLPSLPGYGFSGPAR